jgi:hypothetical protein
VSFVVKVFAVAFPDLLAVLRVSVVDFVFDVGDSFSFPPCSFVSFVVKVFAVAFPDLLAVLRASVVGFVFPCPDLS